MPKTKILEEIADVVEAVNAQELQSGIVIPANVVETLLICQSQHNRVGVAAVCQEILEAAQDQAPAKFPR